MIVDCRGHTRCSSELASTTLMMMTYSGDELSSACSLPSLHGGRERQRERERRDRASVASVVLFPDTVLVWTHGLFWFYWAESAHLISTFPLPSSFTLPCFLQPATSPASFLGGHVGAA